jgi:hypothetical protein
MQTKLPLITIANNDGFLIKMHHIFEVLKLEFTMPLLFWNIFSCMYWFGLLHNKQQHIQ